MEQTFTTSEKVASYLLDIEAIKLRPDNPFQWASGWYSPIYCDNRISLSFPEARKYITEQLVANIKEAFGSFDVIAGVATAGIPQGALVAAVLDLPFVYVRSKPKGHGMENTIEGRLEAGQRVVVLEDLVSTGMSSLKAVDDLRAAGAVVEGMIAIFTYGFDIADQNFKEKGVDLITLSNYSALLDEAMRRGMIDHEKLASLNQWRKSPQTWQGM